MVEVTWNEHTRYNPREQADHLQHVVTHLPKVPIELRRQWLQTVLTFTEDYDLQRGLMALLPSLSGQDHRQAADALVASMIRTGEFYTSETRWSLLPDDALGRLLLRLRKDAYGSPRLRPADGPQSQEFVKTEVTVEKAAIRISVRKHLPRLCGHIPTFSLERYLSFGEVAVSLARR